MADLCNLLRHSFSVCGSTRYPGDNMLSPLSGPWASLPVGSVKKKKKLPRTYAEIDTCIVNRRYTESDSAFEPGSGCPKRHCSEQSRTCDVFAPRSVYPWSLSDNTSKPSQRFRRASPASASDAQTQNFSRKSLTSGLCSVRICSLASRALAPALLKQSPHCRGTKPCLSTPLPIKRTVRF